MMKQHQKICIRSAKGPVYWVRVMRLSDHNVLDLQYKPRKIGFARWQHLDYCADDAFLADTLYRHFGYCSQIIPIN